MAGNINSELGIVDRMLDKYTNIAIFKFNVNDIYSK